MFKITIEERGYAAEQRELAKMKKINLSKKEIKHLNKIVHNKELININDNIKVTTNDNKFYCCGTYWQNSMQCLCCGNNDEDIY